MGRYSRQLSILWFREKLALLSPLLRKQKVDTIGRGFQRLSFRSKRTRGFDSVLQNDGIATLKKRDFFRGVFDGQKEVLRRDPLCGVHVGFL